MTFKKITLKDNRPTPKGERACELVYEALTGECWHTGKHAYNAGNILNPQINFNIPLTYPFMSRTFYACTKCKAIINGKFPHNWNPQLLTSLDAWLPLWERMSPPQKDAYTYALSEVIGSFIHMRYWEPQPHHHLEAALRALHLYETWGDICV